MSDLLGAAFFKNIELIQLDKADHDAAASAVASIFQIADQHGADSRVVKGDGDLSTSGKHARLKTLVEGADRKIHAITKHTLASLQDRALRLQSSIDNQSSVKSTPEMTALHIEARHHLYQMDPLDRDVLLQQLAQSGIDDRTVDAALNASAAAPLVKPEKAAKLKAMKAARCFPGIAGELDKVNQTHATLRNAVSTAKHSIATGPERNFYGVTQIEHDQVPRADAPGA